MRDSGVSWFSWCCENHWWLGIVLWCGYSNIVGTELTFFVD